MRKHENPHVPSSQKRGTTKTGTGDEENDNGQREDESNEGISGSQEKFGSGSGGRGRKVRRDGKTREKPDPDRTEVVLEERCTNCGRKLGDPDRVKTRIVEDIPDTGSVEAVEYKIGCYECGEETVAAHEGISEKGNFGPNVLVQTTLLKFQERVPYVKIQNLFKDVYELKVSTNTLYNFTGRVADQVRPFYEEIRKKVRRCESVHCDETGISLKGEKGWIRTTTTESEVLRNIREDRSQEALEHMLGKNYPGTIICDGWTSYSAYSSNLQRCWSHLLNESEFTADKHQEAASIDEKLHEIYKDLKKFLEEDPPPDKREEKRRQARKS